MSLIPLPYRARSAAAATGLILCAAAAFGATRPHYGGALRIEIREAVESPDPPATGRTVAQLPPAFVVSQWEAPRRAVYAADDNAPGGRPFLDSIEIEMGRRLSDQSIDLDVGKTDVVEIDSNEARRAASGRKVWSSAPVRLLLLVFGSRVEDARIREALARAVDRSAIHNVLLQRQGEISGGLLPQWLSGYAFLFPAAQDDARARALLAAVPPPARALSLAAPDPVLRRIADRIALDARHDGLMVSVAPPGVNPDLRLIELRIASADPARALAQLAAALGLPEPSRTDTPDALYAAERALLDGFRIVPLFHLPDVYGVNPRVKGAPGISPLGEWRMENLWLENSRP